MKSFKLAELDPNPVAPKNRLHRRLRNQHFQRRMTSHHGPTGSNLYIWAL